MIYLQLTAFNRTLLYIRAEEIRTVVTRGESPGSAINGDLIVMESAGDIVDVVTAANEPGLYVVAEAI